MSVATAVKVSWAFLKSWGGSSLQLSADLCCCRYTCNSSCCISSAAAAGRTISGWQMRGCNCCCRGPSAGSSTTCTTPGGRAGRFTSALAALVRLPTPSARSHRLTHHNQLVKQQRLVPEHQQPTQQALTTILPVINVARKKPKAACHYHVCHTAIISCHNKIRRTPRRHSLP